MPELPRRLVYVITAWGVGGAERQVAELATTFHSRGWEVSIVSLTVIREQLLPQENGGVRVASLEMAKGVADPRALVRLARLLRRWRPDVVHAHMVHANLLARLCRPLAPVPRLISTIHNQDEGAQWRYYAYRLTDRLTDITTAVSRLAVDEAVRRHAVTESRVRLVPNGIHTAPFELGAAVRERTRSALKLGDAFTWLAVGRLTEAKRHADLLAASRIVREQVPGVRVLIAGYGPLQAALEEEVDRTGLGSNVTIMGARDDVPALMQAADGFVMSSAWEGLPMVLLEASASSLPIVATDVGGSKDIVVDSQTGFLTPPLQPDRLAGAMLRLMSLSSQERRTMGDHANRLVASRFDMERIADEWEALYRDAKG